MVRGVSAETAAWRPAPERHSIWDLTLHVAYWNYAVQRRITDAPRGGFPRSPANWPAPPSPTPSEAWKADRAVARDARALLIHAVREFDPARIDEPVDSESDTTFATLLMGVVLHDTYHAGQIQLLKGLHADMRGASATPGLGAFSVSLAVSDIPASREFYEKLGFEAFAGDPSENWLILRSGDTVIGLFQGMFEANILTFNPGWSGDAEPLDAFTDVREIQRRLRADGIELRTEVDESTTGPGSFTITDPDGNELLFDQHV